ncbi:MAG: hypothetical protein LC790_04885 [Actinobacteria bacterium]|nr:hypothetical protein [Actinomycetota bacterium]
MSFESDAGLQLAERGVSGRWSTRTIAPQQVFAELVAWGSSGDRVVLAYDRSDQANQELLLLRRASGAEHFDSTTLAQGRAIGDVAAADARGDLVSCR